MAKQTINIGASANDGNGDPLRIAFDKINDNFDELYARDLNTDAQTLTLVGNTLSIANGNSVELNISPVGDLKGSVFADDSTVLVDAVNGKIVGDVVANTVTTPNLVLDGDVTTLNELFIDGGAQAIGIKSQVNIVLQGDVVLGTTSGSSDFYGEIEFNDGTTLFQSLNDVTFNCPVDFTNATITMPQYINLTDLKTLVAASIDFNDFQTRIAAL
jgi:cytoskeletal protein CcmA (bactofilin family)